MKKMALSQRIWSVEQARSATSKRSKEGVPGMCLSSVRFLRYNACVACAPGTTNAAGDDASGIDTTCVATECLENFYASSNVSSQGGLMVTPIVDFEREGDGGQLTAVTRKNTGAGINDRMLTRPRANFPSM